MELVTVPGSNPFSLDDYIKEYLESHPELSIGSQLYIVLRELIASDLILQLKEFMSHMGIITFSKPYIKKAPVNA
jgi:hypothetical protein